MQRAPVLALATAAILAAPEVSPAPLPTADPYPIGICGVPSTADLPALKMAGFNVVLGTANRAYLDAAQAAGLKVWASPGTSAGATFDPVAARRVVAAFDRHPALWAWLLADEPELTWVPPAEVRRAHQTLKRLGARKPTSLILYKAYEALDYGDIPDILLVDRYPVPWLPLANFGQHVTLGRLARGRERPLIPIIQAFDWSYWPEALPGETGLRPPTGREIRCMTYEALARGGDGLFFFAYQAGRWKLPEHPETWEAVKAVVREVHARLPLFRAKRVWWPRQHGFGYRDRRFNEALESSVTSVLLRVAAGNAAVPSGDYVLAVNNTAWSQAYSFAIPAAGEAPSPDPTPARRQPGRTSPINAPGAAPGSVPVLGEGRAILPEEGRLTDTFAPYDVHVYGPLHARQ